VSDVEMSDNGSVLNDEVRRFRAPSCGAPSRLDRLSVARRSNEMLQAAGLRPPVNAMALGWLLFGKGARHLRRKCSTRKQRWPMVPVSLATVYNTLNQLTDAGLLRQVSVDGTKTYFDTNRVGASPFLLENNHELVDIPDPHLVLQKMPEVPEG